MKQLHSTLLLTTFISALSLYSMKKDSVELVYLSKQEMQEAAKKISLETMVTTIDSAIQKKNLGLFQFNMLSALSTPTECYPKIAPTNELLIKLSEKNAHFLVSLMNFIALAREEAEKVTPLSLTTIENPQLQQATIALNQLNFSIKKYIMNCALEQINHSYNLTFPVQPAKTMGFTISAKTQYCCYRLQRQSYLYLGS